jgi:hypothetical protein
MSFALETTTWSAFPRHTCQEIRSGIVQLFLLVLFSLSISMQPANSVAGHPGQSPPDFQEQD